MTEQGTSCVKLLENEHISVSVLLWRRAERVTLAELQNRSALNS